MEIVYDDRIIAPSRRRERCLLAVLLLELNHVVTGSRLAELLWDGAAPDGARATLRSHVSRVRAVLEAAGAPAAGVALTHVRGGYQLTADPGMVDAQRFRTLIEDAKNIDDLDQRIDCLRTAIDLWGGQALDNAASEWLRVRLCTDLEEQRLRAIEQLASDALVAGQGTDVLPELARIVGSHPTREALVGLCMRALHHAGRRAEALTVFTRTRNLLSEELGIDPGPALRSLHQAMLRDQLPPPVSVTDSDPQTPAPRQLPADVTAFTGRDNELRVLDGALDGLNSPAPVSISVIAGTARVGKTALAVHWSHRNRDRFPDGQLFMNLRGYHPGQPTDPAEALTRLLAALGVTGQDVPYDVDDRAARYRSELADKRMLILLDNARSVEQVRPLLPGSSSSMVVVTSRDSLAGLVAVHGAHRLELDLLPPAEALALLRRLIGSRVDTEADATGTLINQCARLPLALRVAAELADSRPTTSLNELVAELGDRQRRLNLLDGAGDPHAAIRMVFSWSVQHLPPDTATMFRLLGLHPGPDTDPYAAAALADISLDEAHRRLELLRRAHLLQPTGPGRYGMHDLLHAYAAELTYAHDTEEERHAAQGRLLGHCCVPCR